MDKYAVQNVRKMQEATLGEVRGRLIVLRRDHTKTAAEGAEIDRLVRQERELEQALAESASADQ